MPLGYTQQQPLQYNTFLKTSFGFGTNALQSLPNNPFPNATDYAKVIITVDNTTNWGDTAHIQTQQVGTAVSVYDSETFIWEVEGQRDDVETVLAELVFYPPVYQALVDWRPVALKENNQNGIYFQEQPSSAATVADTEMDIVVYNSSGWVTGRDIYIVAIEPEYNNPRPYFLRDPIRAIDISHPDYDTPEGKEIPLDLQVENWDDEEILEVKAEFIRVSDGTQYTGSAFGEFADYQNIYIGGKKGLVPNNTDKRFSFVGVKEECNSFLPNLEFTANPSGGIPIFDMSSFFIRASVSDGQVGSYIDTLVWNADTNISYHANITGQSYTEDTAANWDLGVVTLQNFDRMSEVDTFTAVITLEFSGLSVSGAEQFYPTTSVDNQTLTEISGQNHKTVLTITDSNFDNIRTALRNLVFLPKQDFSSNFTFGLDFEFESSVYGSLYRTPNFGGGLNFVVTATATQELSFATTNHNFTEDTHYNLSTGDVPQIIHLYDETFQIDFIASPTVIGGIDRPIGNIKTFNNNVTFSQVAEGHTRFTGSRADVNAALNQAYYSPNPDVNGTVTFSIHLNRLTGNLDFHQTTYGSISLTATDNLDVSFNNPGPLDWEEDVTLEFNAGINLLDDSTTNPFIPAYGTQYTAIVRLRDPYGNASTKAKLTSDSKTLLTSYIEDDSIFTMTGSRSAINICLDNLKMIPDVDWEGYDAEYVDTGYVDTGYAQTLPTAFYVEFYIRRNYDNEVLLNYNPNYRVYFNNPTTHEETSYTPTFVPDYMFKEDSSLSFDTGLQILDKATENEDITDYYNTTYTLEARVKTKDTYMVLDYVDDDYVATRIQDLNIFKLGNGRIDLLSSYSGTGTVADPFIMSATKSNFNTALANMRFTASEVDRELTHDEYLIEYKVYRTQDNKTYYDFDINTTVGKMQWHEEITFSHGYEQWDINTVTVFDSTIEILDLATENELYTNYYDSTYTVEVRTNISNPYVDSGYIQTGYVDETPPLDNVRISSTQTHLLDSVSGTGRGYDSFIMTGSRSAINACLAQMKMIPDVDWVAPGDFYFTYKVTRDADGVVLSYSVYADQYPSTTFSQVSTELYSSNYAPNFGTFYFDRYRATGISKSAGINPYEGRIFHVKDNITRSTDYPGYYDTDYLLKLKVKYWNDNPGRFEYLNPYTGGQTATIDINNRYPNNTQGITNDGEFYVYAKIDQIDKILNGDFPQLSTTSNIRVMPSPTSPTGPAPYSIWDSVGNLGVNEDRWLFLEVYIERVFDGAVISDWETHTLKTISGSLGGNLFNSQLNWEVGAGYGTSSTGHLWSYGPADLIDDITDPTIEYFDVWDVKVRFKTRYYNNWDSGYDFDAAQRAGVYDITNINTAWKGSGGTAPRFWSDFGGNVGGVAVATVELYLSETHSSPFYEQNVFRLEVTTNTGFPRRI